MSKERLEEIKEWYEFNHGKSEWKVVPIQRKDFKWFIEQVEKYDEMIKEFIEIKKRYKFTYHEIDSDRKKLKEQNKNYREAIEKALNEGVHGDCSNAIDKIYGILGEALEES